MKRLKLVVALVAVAVVGTPVLVYGIWAHDTGAVSERNRKAAQTSLTAAARGFLTALPGAFDSGPQDEATLRKLFGGATLAYVSGESTAGSVVVSFQAEQSYADPPAPYPDLITVCYQDVITRTAGTAHGEASEVPCAELGHQPPGWQLVLP
ncbi:hypothetical protein OG455_25910 [Kitasatospora sp. NBC_01287]|uniref:hypothetical protein n=1 Tax=Kitasatospora sp. NBC_01287 TaxID=2903573 RepID=UPI002255B941|nr:hypothetical protein [Kitasatospora sp. NBC_01287]MCX4748911.1 hypothetical protein [Kitasatospora sp. NBC_01287]